MSGNLAGISLAPRQRSTGRRGFFKDRALELHNDGYAVVPIPIGRKGPVKEGWTQFGNAQTRPQVEALIREAGDGDGIGIVAKHTPMVDLDIRDHELVRKLSDLANDELGWTPDRIGQAPKTGKPYRCSKPFPKIVGREFRLPSDKPTDKPHRIEVLCDGQQWVAHHWHPETDLPYHWEDDLPPRDELPDIDEEMAWAFVTKAEEIIAENDGKFVDQVGRANGRAAANCNTGEHVNGGTYQLGDVEAIASALEAIPNSDAAVSWDTWNRIAMAIKAAIGEHGWPLFQAWSGRNPKFNAATTAKLWNGINREAVHTCGAQTVYGHASDHGWVPPADVYLNPDKRADVEHGAEIARRILEAHQRRKEQAQEEGQEGRGERFAGAPDFDEMGRQKSLEELPARMRARVPARMLRELKQTRGPALRAMAGSSP